MIEIDGSYGEGGGQILRTALSLSCLFERPFRIFNIRKGRKKPGLMPQHLTAVRAAQLLSNAEVTGNNTGSTELVFSPGEVRGGDFFFDIGTAGSTSLVLQTIIPALVFSRGVQIPFKDSMENENPPQSPFAKGGLRGITGKVGDGGLLKQKSTITLKGGTHVPFSPCFQYLAGVFATFLKKIGIEIRLTIESYGFYPKGGGNIKAEVFPAQDIKPLNILEKGHMTRLRGYSGVGNLPLSIAERQRNAMVEKIYSIIKDLVCPLDVELMNVQTPGQGTFVFLKSESEHSIAGFTSLGEWGKRAEVVGEEAATEFINYYETASALDPHISDQIVLYLSLCKEESIFTTSCITEHLMTNLWVIGLFHELRYSVEGEVGKPGIVRINQH